MTRRLVLIALFPALLLSACGPTSASNPGILPELVTVTPDHPNVQPAQATPQASPTAAASLTVAFTPTPELTDTPENTDTPSVPAPTDTSLPQLVLPTEKANAPALTAWTGLPTYPGDSDPGLLFRVDYDPDIWAQTEGNFGAIVLGNRQFEYCTITPWEGRGLPADWKVEHEFRTIGSASFDVSTVTFQGVVKFVSYVGGDRRVLTGFQVTFNDQKEKCLQDAEAIFGTLRSFSAVPTITPTFTPEMPTPLISAGQAVTVTPAP